MVRRGARGARSTRRSTGWSGAVATRRELRWWGWGERRAAPGAARARALGLLRDELGARRRAARRPVALADVRLRRAGAAEPAARRGCAARRRERVRDDRADARRCTPPARATPTSCGCAPATAQARPTRSCARPTPTRSRRVLEPARRERVAVVPVRRRHERRRRRRAGARRLRGGRLARPRRAWTGCSSSTSARAPRRCGPGMRGPRLEALLGARGLDARALPAELRVRRRSAAASPRARRARRPPGYGPHRRATWWACAAPRRRASWPRRRCPAPPPAPTLRELLVGSEGALGVICRGRRCACARAGRARRYEGWSFALVRRAAPRRSARSSRTARAGRRAALRRDGDAHVARARRARGGVTGDARWRATCGARGFDGGCMVDLRLGGRAGGHRAPPRGRGVGCCASAAASALGRSPGRGWARGRFHGALPARRPARPRRDGRDARDRDDVDEPHALHARSRDALRDALRARHAAVVVCHVSHLYPTGASLYFTFLARQERGRRVEQWRGGQAAACDAIVAARRHDHPPPRGRPRPRAVAAAEIGRWASRRCGRSKSRARPGRAS